MKLAILAIIAVSLITVLGYQEVDAVLVPPTSVTETEFAQLDYIPSTGDHLITLNFGYQNIDFVTVQKADGDQLQQINVTFNGIGTRSITFNLPCGETYDVAVGVPQLNHWPAEQVTWNYSFNCPSTLFGIQHFTATPGNGQVMLTWDAPLDNHHDPVFEYTVALRVSNSGENLYRFSGDVYTAKTGQLVTGLTNGISYDFQVVAHNSLNGTASDIISATPIADLVPENNGSDRCNDCTAPEIQDLQFLNGTQWYVPIDKVTMNIGEPQSIRFTIDENQGINDINYVELGIGLKNKYTPISISETLIDVKWQTDHVEKIVIDDENKLFVENSTSISTKVIGNLLEFTMNFTFAESPDYPNFMLRVSDDSSNKKNYRFDFPVKVEGECLNEQPTYDMLNRYSELYKEDMIIPITRIDKVNNLWQSESGIILKSLGNDRFEVVSIK